MAHYDIILPIQPADAVPAVRSIGLDDLNEALRRGLQDFWALPTHVIFLCLIYPVAGLLIFRATFAYDLFPLLYPLASDSRCSARSQQSDSMS